MLTSREFRGLIVAGVVFIALALIPWVPAFTQPVHHSRNLGAAFDGVLAVIFSGAMTLIGVALVVAAVFLRRRSIGGSSSEKPFVVVEISPLHSLTPSRAPAKEKLHHMPNPTRLFAT
jgi:hypothetical protein